MEENFEKISGSKNKVLPEMRLIQGKGGAEVKGKPTLRLRLQNLWIRSVFTPLVWFI
jgi:hypothetical protein